MSEYKELEPLFKKLADFDTLVGKIPDCIYVNIRELLENTSEELDGSYEDLITDYETFDACFGGDVFLLKEIDDLRAIEISKVDEDGSWQTLLDGVCDWFEFVDQIGEKDENGIGEFILVVHCNNNAGGPSYFIPRDFYYQVPTVHELVEIYKKES